MVMNRLTVAPKPVFFVQKTEMKYARSYRKPNNDFVHIDDNNNLKTAKPEEKELPK